MKLRVTFPEDLHEEMRKCAVIEQGNFAKLLASPPCRLIQKAFKEKTKVDMPFASMDIKWIRKGEFIVDYSTYYNVWKRLNPILLVRHWKSYSKADPLIKIELIKEKVTG